MTVYLNIAEFGPDVFGVEAASQRYFHKPASQPADCRRSGLAGGGQPNLIRFRAAAQSGYVRQRQQWILRQMRQLGDEGFLQRNRLD